ncbi:hypothetical protein VTJ83DRAFT_4100 [Remersonia thermophila]|uniref:DNA-directed RNA polymerase subunit n=1 Tax=Remersonia thermophila TaxID=72144 RepID=A0ABR4DGT2_9PEZI
MSSSNGEPSQDATVVESYKSEKKHKRSKSDHTKKRPRDDDDTAAVPETPRKSKKNRNKDADSDAAAPVDLPGRVEESPKKKKKEKRRDKDAEDSQDTPPAQSADEAKKERKKSGKSETDAGQSLAEPMDVDPPDGADAAEAKPDKKRKEKKSKKQKSEGADRAAGSSADEDDGDQGQKKKKRKSKDKDRESSSALATASEEPSATQQSTADLPIGAEFPFYNQTISLYVPFYPVGFDKPLTNIASQHLEPLLNHYSPTLRGVLLGYSNLNLADRPVAASVIHPPSDQTPALLHSVDEYAVGFGWLTFDAQLFVPSRGKWMEGVVQLQSEGHVGVVCWNRFNASIESKRLPKGWKWVDLAKAGAKPNTTPPSGEEEGDKASRDGEDSLDGEELQVVEQIHTTGYWVNETGKKVAGKLRFRIKNFDVGLAGDYGYLSIEGTCLDDEAERALTAQEREMERARRSRQNPNGLLRPLSRRVPEFSMTRFGRESQEEDDGQRAVLYKGSRPGTPDD